jgi:hypothetical protein
MLTASHPTIVPPLKNAGSSSTSSMPSTTPTPIPAASSCCSSGMSVTSAAKFVGHGLRPPGPKPSPSLAPRGPVGDAADFSASVLGADGGGELGPVGWCRDGCELPPKVFSPPVFVVSREPSAKRAVRGRCWPDSRRARQHTNRESKVLTGKIVCYRPAVRVLPSRCRQLLEPPSVDVHDESSIPHQSSYVPIFVPI